jgi:hypothetical protein
MSGRYLNFIAIGIVFCTTSGRHRTDLSMKVSNSFIQIFQTAFKYVAILNQNFINFFRFFVLREKNKLCASHGCRADIGPTSANPCRYAIILPISARYGHVCWGDHCNHFKTEKTIINKNSLFFPKLRDLLSNYFSYMCLQQLVNIYSRITR